MQEIDAIMSGGNGSESVDFSAFHVLAGILQQQLFVLHIDRGERVRIAEANLWAGSMQKKREGERGGLNTCSPSPYFLLPPPPL